jgi:hypothetical protein
MPLFVPLGLMTTSAPATATFIAQTADASGGSSHNFTSQTLKASMVICVSCIGGATQGVSAMTVGGISATLVIAQGNTGGAPNEDNSSIWRVSGVTPGTGTIAVTFTTAYSECAIATFETVGRAAAASATDSIGWAAAGSNPTKNINVPANGFVIAAASTVSADTWTWTGPTERSDGTTPSYSQTTASQNYTAAQTPLTVTATRSGTAKGAFVVASWAPA